MAIYKNTPPIVTNGLVLHLDAANRLSYPGSGTVWRDLSGNGYSGSLINTPAYSSDSGGYFSFNASNQSISTNYIQPAQNTSTSFSWGLWVYPTRNSDRDVFIGNRGTTLNFTKLTSTRFEYYPVSLAAVMPLNVWQNVYVVKDTTNIYYYRNGIRITSTTTSVTQNENAFNIGGDSTTTEYSQGRIAHVQVYNRVLTQQEILQNYNATKTRYGLT